MFWKKKPEYAAPEEHIQGLSSLYGGLLESVSELKAGVDSIENKAGAILAATLAVISVFSSVSQLRNRLTNYGVAMLAVSSLLAVVTLVRGNYITPVKKIKKTDSYLSMKDEELLLHLVADAQNAVNKTLDKLEAKGVLFKWTLITFVLGTAILVAPNFITSLK